jgi:hypothetical protein
MSPGRNKKQTRQPGKKLTRPKKMSNQPKILRTEIQRPTIAAKAETPARVPPLLRLAIEVENPNNQPLHVWASPKSYEYNASTHVLSIYLTEHIPPLPPGIKMISDHPRTPAQVEIAPKSRSKIKVQIPATIRRRVPGGGLGMSFVEEKIEPVGQVEVHLQYADEPVRHDPHETPDEHRKRLREHGEVVRTTVKEIEYKEEQEQKEEQKKE